MAEEIVIIRMIMRKSTIFLAFLAFLHLWVSEAYAASSALLGWNNLGMHCMDSRYAEFAILPPYNTIEAQLVVNGKLIDPALGGYTVTYEAMIDPVTQALNTTSVNKSDWSAYAPKLFGLSSVDPDIGLAGCRMPGTGNAPQEMWSSPHTGIAQPAKSFHAEGIPITPYDDDANGNFKKNTYPMMKLVARSGGSTGTVLAESAIVLPVSDEMSCKNCHAANTNTNAKPESGWITDAILDREYRLNILKLHDEKEFKKDSLFYSAALSNVGIVGKGLFEAATTDNKPVLCAACHQSEALGAKSFSSGGKTVPSLTSSIHTTHAPVTAPGNPLSLNATDNRSACYECHPGSETRCLRGAMGSAVATDGSMEMQCQSCHGNMSKVGDVNRTGWLQEPVCQSCHTGTAIDNAGQIRYTSVFDSSGNERQVINQTFATNANTPAPNISLYRFSKGHGDLQCSACHGSTHAEFPSSHGNDNLRNVNFQGHEGVTAECEKCHTSGIPSTSYSLKGPHGLHPLDNNWVEDHHDYISSEENPTECKTCHGSDLRGTELSRVQGDRSFSLGDSSGTQKFYRGATVGCYTCHNGTGTSSMSSATVPVTQDVTANTVSGQQVDITLPISQKASGVTVQFRVIKQPQHGTVGVIGAKATYYPDTNFAGTDSFTFSGYDGSKNTDTNIQGNTVPATAAITVNPSAPTIIRQPVDLETSISSNAARFSIVASGPNLTYQWYKDSDANPVPGATTDTLTLTSLPAESVGKYRVVVTNSVGTVYSVWVNLTLTGVKTTTSLSASPNPSEFGKAITLTATVNGAKPTGNVEFYDGTTRLSSASLNNSTATYTTPALAVGLHTLSAKYLGDSYNQTSNSTVFNQTVNKANTITTLVSSLNPSIAGNAVTVTASVTGISPTGTVTFADGVNSLCNGPVTLSGNGNTQIATCSVTLTTVGNHSIVATYNGDNSNNSSTSLALVQVVNSAPVTKATTTTTLASSLNPSLKGQTVTFTINLAGGNTPTGSMTFKDGSTTLKTFTVTINGNFTYSTKSLARGSHNLTASYSGDSKNKASSAFLTQTVK